MRTKMRPKKWTGGRQNRAPTTFTACVELLLACFASRQGELGAERGLKECTESMMRTMERKKLVWSEETVEKMEVERSSRSIPQGIPGFTVRRAVKWSLRVRILPQSQGEFLESRLPPRSHRTKDDHDWSRARKNCNNITRKPPAFLDRRRGFRCEAGNLISRTSKPPSKAGRDRQVHGGTCRPPGLVRPCCVSANSPEPRCLAVLGRASGPEALEQELYP